MELFGIRLVGLNAATGHKLVLTLGLVLIVALVGVAAKAGLGRGAHVGHDATSRADRARFWSRQGLNLLIAVVAAVGLASIWFDDPANLNAASGLFTAGLAFALQKVVTAIAGYFIILRGNNFTVGDRITMGGVRGDVIALGFFQTTIMEMGEPPATQDADPAVWVRSRQFTGRIVTVANSKIFDEPIYNYTRDFPFIWEELHLPIAYRDDRVRAEALLLEAARKHAVKAGEVEPALLDRLAERFDIQARDFEPRVYWRLTDNWLELTVRFITHDHGVRHVKDAMSRELLAGLDRAGIGIASATMEITGLPHLVVERGGSANRH
jgi:small-conductance mechanosensitive channel